MEPATQQDFCKETDSRGLGKTERIADFCRRRKGTKCRQADWYTDNIRLTVNRTAEINNFKFNHCQQCSVPSDHVKLQTNNVNLLLRSTDEVKTIFFPELILVIKKIKETTA